MVKVILEGPRCEVYAMGSDLMEAKNVKGESLFGDITISGETFQEKDDLESKGSLMLQTDRYNR